MSTPDKHSPDPKALRRGIERLVGQTFSARLSRLEPVAGGLGSRLFFRAFLDSGPISTAIARVELPEDPALRPPGIPPEPPLEPIRRFLSDGGVPVPERYALDARLGIELLEDAGAYSLEEVAKDCSPRERASLYAEAVAWLPRLQQLQSTPDQVAAFGRHLDATLFQYKAEQFIEWALPWALGRPASAAEAGVVREAFALVASVAAEAPARLAHRDYKAANLHLRSGPQVGATPPGAGRLMMIDLQGAFLAPPEYDLVSLLRDSQVPLPWSEVQSLLAAVRPELPDAPDRENFLQRFDLLTLTRNGKVLARFLYAARERGDLRYLPYVPREVAILQLAANRVASSHPRLRRLNDLIHQLSHGPVTQVTEPPAPTTEMQVDRKERKSSCAP